MAYILKTDGTKVPVTPENGKKFTLEELQAVVGGYIEGVPGTNYRAWVNEEGLLRGLPYNTEASKQFNQNLVGDVLVMEKGDKS